MAANASVSYGLRLTHLAAEHPNKPVIVFVPESGPEQTYSWLQLEQSANRMARLFREHGVKKDSIVVIGLRNNFENVAASFAIWKLGACLLPLSHRMPAAEREAVLEIAQPDLVVANWGRPGELTISDLGAASALASEPLPDVVPQPGRAIASGGSTGTPKIIVDPRPLAARPDIGDAVVRRLTGIAPGQVQLLCGPLYHNGPYGSMYHGLFHDHTVVLMERFDAARAVDLIERYGVNWLYLVPTMMRRIIQLPGIEKRDFSHLQAIYHSASPCPINLKRAWIDLVGAERVYEGFGATEEVGLCAIRGDEWLQHPGSVGRPQDSEIKIRDSAGNPLSPGEVGEIYMRRTSRVDTYRYLGGAEAKRDVQGFVSVGDLGWVDEEGYLFVADRRVDMIITGGSNVYPGEVEAVLLEHPAIADVVVIGLPDEDWGKRVHAIVQPRDPASPPSAEALTIFCKERLLPYKVPKDYEFVLVFPRDEAGKIRRLALIAERSASATAL
jgi:bile acid-coenzyme A ligase